MSNILHTYQIKTGNAENLLEWHNLLIDAYPYFKENTDFDSLLMSLTLYKYKEDFDSFMTSENNKYIYPELVYNIIKTTRGKIIFKEQLFKILRIYLPIYDNDAWQLVKDFNKKIAMIINPLSNIIIDEQWNLLDMIDSLMLFDKILHSPDYYNARVLYHILNVDIVKIIGKYVKLNKRGDNYRGNSPFETDTAQSLMVSREKGIWKDFLSGKGGNANDFIREMNTLNDNSKRSKK